MRILITGATGFVGTHLRAYLLRHTDWEIVGTSYPDQPPSPLDPKREQLIYLDLRDAEATRNALTAHHPAYIVHLAAQSHIPTAYKNPWGTLENNILGQLNLLEACRALDPLPRVLIIGSGEEYGRGDPTAMPLTETSPLRPENPYSVSKVTQDVLGYQYFISYGLPVLRVRPFNHIGPHQSPRFVLPAFAQQIAKIEARQQSPVMRVGEVPSALITQISRPASMVAVPPSFFSRYVRSVAKAILLPSGDQAGMSSAERSQSVRRLRLEPSAAIT